MNIQSTAVLYAVINGEQIPVGGACFTWRFDDLLMRKVYQKAGDKEAELQFVLKESDKSEGNKA